MLSSADDNEESGRLKNAAVFIHCLRVKLASDSIPRSFLATIFIIFVAEPAIPPLSIGPIAACGFS